MQTMSSAKKTLLVVAVNVAALAVGIFFLEAVFGNWLTNHTWWDTNKLRIIRDRVVHIDAKSIYGPDAKPIIYTRDKFGLRGSCSDLKDIFILTLGGSTTDQRYITDGKTWQDVLQTELKAYTGRKNICVSNAGVDGHGTYGHLASFECWFPLVPNLRPEFFLLYLGINDAGFRAAPTSYEDNETAVRSTTGFTGKIWYSIQRNSALLALFDFIRDQRISSHHSAYAWHHLNTPDNSDYVVTAPTPGVEKLIAENSKRFKKRLRKLFKLIKEKGATPICVSQPTLLYRKRNSGWEGIQEVFSYKGQTFNGLDFRLSLLSLNKIMKQECRARGGIYIDLESKSFLTSDFYDSIHMKPAGARKVGRYIFSELVKSGALKKP